MDLRIFEEHSSVLPQLWDQRSKGRTLIYLDAHLDLQPINSQRLAKLQNCTTMKQLKAQEKPHHLLPDRDYGYSLEDWLFPAHRLEMFQQLIWVAPPHVQVGFTAEVFAHLEQMAGVTVAEIAGFRELPAGAVSGVLGGIPITICNYHQLGELELPENALIDIDTDYFIEIPGDRVWVNPREVFDALDELPLKPELVTLSRSAGSGFLPLRNRYIADYLAALWQRRAADADHYERLFKLDSKLFSGASDGVADALEQESQSHPGCAATWHLRSQLDPGSEASLSHQQQAQQLDPAYRETLLTRACAYPNRHLPVDRAAYTEMEHLLATQALSEQQTASAQVALGLILCAAGQINAAIHKYSLCTAHFGSHPFLALEIGKALIATGNASDAGGFLTAALEDDNSRVSAQVYLAQMRRDSGQLEHALELASAVHTAAPAWGEATLLLADIHQRLGNKEIAADLAAQRKEQEQQLATLIQQHASGSAGHDA
jgi:Tfp pilus assembly protein PilF